MQVNAIGTALVAADNAVSGVPRGKIVSGVLGDLVCRYTYDGLGRLILKETPINTGVTSLQRKDLYYDGVRRIQEVITRLRDPADLPTVPTTTGPDEMGNDELPEELLLEGGGQQPMTIIEPPPSGGPLGDIVVWTDREYVYGPAYVDEFVCQLDRDGRIIYMLQDGNYNVVALIAGYSEPGGPPPGRVLEQYTYDPYGTVLAAENLDRDPVTGRSRHAVNRVGFQGLFFERYDGSYTEPSIAPGVAGLYYARNRFYSPMLGRFIQRDPNETGLPIIAAMVTNGEAVSLLFSGFDAQALYGDGMNVYQFAGSNPVNNRDPSGLDDEVWADFDDAIGGLYQDRLGAYGYTRDALAQAQRGSFLAQLYARMAFAWDELVWDQNEQALFSLALGGMFARACFEAGTPVLLQDGSFMPIEAVEVGAPVASSPDTESGTSDAEEIVPSHWRVVRLRMEDAECREAYVVLLRSTDWLMDVDAKVEGLVQLSVPEMGVNGTAEVVSIESCPGHIDGSASCLVTGTFVRGGIETIALYFDSSMEPVKTTARHPFYSLDRASWTPAGELRTGERLQTASGETTLKRMEQSPHTATVYNLEVQGTHTYFVSESRLWVHNGCVKPDWVKNSDTFCSWMRNLQEVAKAAARAGRAVARLTAEEAADLVSMARKYGVRITVDSPHPGEGAPWNTMRHLHFGDGRFHVPCPDGFVP